MCNRLAACATYGGVQHVPRQDATDLPNDRALSAPNTEYPEFYFGMPRNEVVKFVPKSCRRILEVGCGNGAFRAHFSPKVEYWGVEAQEGPAADAAKRLTKIIRGRFDDSLASLPSNYFDVVVCNDVIEHMADHRHFLSTIQSYMTPSASLVGSVPNIRLLSNLARLLIKRDWAYTDSGILDYTHLRFFTQKSLSRELLEAGFDIERLEGINPLGSREQGLARLAKVALSYAAAPLMGRDTRFVQFGFRAKLRGSFSRN